MSIRVSIVVPAFNEALRLPPTLRAIQARLAERWPGDHELIVVDDGSKDDTAQVAQAFGARVIALPENRGKGAAVRAGVLEARGDMIAFMDADGSIAIGEVEKLFDAVAAGADIAVASRWTSGSGEEGARSKLRELASSVFRGLVGRLAPTGVHDTQCGAKAFRREVAHTLCAAQTIAGFAFDVELLWLARRYPLPVAEVPVIVRHEAASKVAMLRHAAPMLLDVARIRLRHLRSSRTAAPITARMPPR